MVVKRVLNKFHVCTCCEEPEIDTDCRLKKAYSVFFLISNLRMGNPRKVPDTIKEFQDIATKAYEDLGHNWLPVVKDREEHPHFGERNCTDGATIIVEV